MAFTCRRRRRTGAPPESRFQNRNRRFFTGAHRKCIKAGEERLRNELKIHHGQGVVDWRIQFAEVFAFPPRGFDLALANPPYVRKENIDATAKPVLRSIYGAAVTGQSDLFCYFYARGLQLLGRGGVHIFICSFIAAIADQSLRRETNVARSMLWCAPRNGHSPANGSYAGGKWGGRYLRSPDIYRSIVEKAEARLQPLASVARVDGYIHDNNTGGEFPHRRFLKSVKDAKQIKLTADCPGVVLYGVKQEGNSSLKAPILFPRTFGERHIVLWNVDGVYGKEFYKIIPKSAGNEISIVAQLNSTFGILQRELLGLVNLGDGAIKFSANDVGLFQIAVGVDTSRIRKPFEQLAWV